MTNWDVRPATKRVERQWQELRKNHPQAAQTALQYWADDPFAPHGLVVRPRAKLAARVWGSGGDKRTYEQRGFVVADTAAFFIVVDDIGAVIITALMQFLTDPDV